MPSLQRSAAIPTPAFLRRCLQRLRAADVPDADSSMGHLLRAALGDGTHRVDGPLPRRLSREVANSLAVMVARRAEREPVQYIVGDWDFRYLNLKMRPPVLIPRPETELLVSLALDRISALPQSSVRVLEVGCGSGAVCLSLLEEVRGKELSVVALDCSPEAVALTRENAARTGLEHGLDLHLLRVTAEPAVLSRVQQVVGEVHLVVSNPPYVPSAEVAALAPELRFEDRVALDGGADGLDVVRDLIALSARVLRPGGRILLEVDARHPALLQRHLLAPTRGLAPRLRFLRSHEDQCFRSRFVELFTAD